MDNNGKTMIILIVAALLLAAGAFMYFQFANQDIEVNSNPDLPPANNMQNNNTEDDEWIFATTTEYSIQYPRDLGLEYIEMMDWPPTVELTADEFTCEEAGTETDRAGATESVTINGADYCRTTIVEGAAGSTYTQYAYAFANGDGTATLTFATRAPECSNYDTEEMEACEEEVDDLDIDDLADRVARTLRIEDSE
jgi:hypothetical protein